MCEVSDGIWKASGGGEEAYGPACDSDGERPAPPRIVVAPESKERQCHPLISLGTTAHWLASHVDLEHLPSFEVDVQRVWPSVDRYNTAGKRGARPP